MTTFDDGTLHVDFADQEVQVDGKPIDLNEVLFHMLATLVHKAGQTVSAEQLLGLPEDDPVTLERVKHVVLRLREKMGWEGKDSPIQIVQGGYRYRSRSE